MPTRKEIISIMIIGIVLILALTFISSGIVVEGIQESKDMNQENTQTNEQHTEVQTASDSSEGVTISQESSSTQHTSVSSDSSNNEHLIESEMTVTNGEDTTQIHIDGNIEPKETITVTATQNGSPMTNVTVLVNDKPVELTDKSGEAQITVPADGGFVLEFIGEDSTAEFRIS